MKLSRKLKLRIIIGIAVAMILYGVLDRFIKFNIDHKVIDNVGMVLMIIAFGLLFSRGDQTARGERANSEAKAVPGGSQDESQIEQTALENDMVRDQDKGATNNDDSRNDLRS